MHNMRIKTRNRDWLEWEWMRTSATSHNVLSRNGISTQLMNTIYSSCISECKTKIKQNTLSTTVDNQKGSNMGPHQSPIYCSWTSPPNFVFYNYEEFAIAYVKSRKSEDYLGTEMGLRLFEWSLDSWSLFENWSIWN